MTTEIKPLLCLHCGHQHHFELRNWPVDSSDRKPLGKCRECPCAMPNYESELPMPEKHRA